MTKRPSDAPRTGGADTNTGRCELEERTPAGGENSTEWTWNVEERRDALVETVETRDVALTVDELVDELVTTDRANGGHVPPRWADLHERLYYVELPALDDSNRVTFDVRRGVVTPADGVSSRPSVDRRLVPGLGPSDRWRYRYLAVAGVAVLGFVATVLDLGPLAAVPPLASAGAVVVAFVGLALFHADR